MLLWASPLGAEIKSFSRWVEGHLRGDERGPLRIMIEDNRGHLDGDPSLLDRWHRVWRMMEGLGITELELDARLESDQVMDIVALLVSLSRFFNLQGARQPNETAMRLKSSAGLSFACAVARLQGQSLVVTYSYCMTRFSALVSWFKNRQTHLGDHRSLFRAAPRYAGLAGLTPVVVFLLFAAHASWSLLLVTSLLGSAVLAGATYLFFMTVGSVEYDNEEKAHSLKQANEQLRRYAERIRSDMDRARVVQQQLLPDAGDMPLDDHLEWAADFAPQEEVGGDYFDASLTIQGRVAVVFADVSGHGLGAALITAMIKTTFETWLEHDDDLGVFIRLLNRRLIELTPAQSFAAVMVGIYDPDRHSFSYCNCGHSPYPYRVSAAEGAARPLKEAQHVILGVLPDIDPQPATVRMNPGDTLLFATDGITESRNNNEEEYGEERLARYLTGKHEVPLREMVGGLVDAVESFTSSGAQTDDRTILAVRVR